MIKRMISVLLTVMMVVSVVVIGVVNTGGAETDAVVTGWSIPSEIEFFQKLVTLRTRYPNGSTWDGTYYEGEKPKAFTAWGYACQIMYEVFGAMFYADSLLNYKNYSTSNLCAGDWVRIDSDSHSIFITKVTSGGVYYTDCNGTGVYNQIRWDGYCSWSEFRNRFSYRVHLPGNSLKGDYHEHIPGEPVQENVVPATCKAEGFYDKVVYCTKCGEEISREQKKINKLDHTPGDTEQENVVPASCTVNGSYDVVVYCTECGEEISREQKKINKLDHTPGDPVRENAVPATCETEGSYDEIVYCTECGEEISRELKTIDKLDHDIRYAEEVPATRTVDGMKAHFECTRCHKYFADSMGHIEISAETLIIKAEHLRGDANTDGVLDITDVTTIQRVLAEHSVWSYDEVAADADLDGIVDIIDAVLLSRILAVMTTFERWDNSHMLANTGIAHDRLYETNSSDKTISSVGDSQTAIISIYGFNGQYETKSINVGDTFDVYTYLNASDLVDKGKIAGIDAYQMYTDSTLSLNSTIYPIFNDNIVYNVDNIGKILYNALTPEIDYPFVFNSDNDVIIKTTYTVTAPGQGEVRNAIKTLAAADEDITPIIKNGEIANNSVINVEVSFDKREHIHVPSSVVKENVIPATCKFEGTYDEVVYCTECGEEISRVAKTIDKLDHTPGEAVQENVVPATCTVNGSYDVVTYCTVCKSEISRETKYYEGGHSILYIPEVKSTYDAPGVKAHYQCTVCDKLFADEAGNVEVTDDDLHIPLVEMKIGDINKDYEITVMDTTFIQFYLSYQRSLNGGEYEPVEIGSRDFTVADVDGDGRISIFDALRIQRYCAKMCKLDGSPYDD